MSSNKQYSIVEPHPSVPATQHFSTGRGGAGNVAKAPSSVTRGSNASGPAARVNLASVSAPRKSFTTGRGGAGNVHPSSERAIFSFDEELERQLGQDQHAAPVYHVGRGGAGNVTSSTATQSRVYVDGNGMRRSEDRESLGSTGSSGSGADYVNRNTKRGFMMMWCGGNFLQG